MADTAETAGTAETVLLTSVLSTFRFFVVLAAGYLASTRPAREPLLTKEVCRNFSRVVMDLFLPCLLLASIGGTLNPGTLRDSWHLVVGSALSIVLSNATAWAFGWLLMSREARPTFRPVQMAIAFPNSLVFPLLLLDALCEQDIINSDFAGDSNECYDQATGMIFVFVACWQILFFGWGVYCLKEDNALELSLTSPPTSAIAAISSSNLDEERAVSAGQIRQPLPAAELSQHQKGSSNGGGSNSRKSESPPSSTTFNPVFTHTFYPKPAAGPSGGYGSRVAGSAGTGEAAAGRGEYLRDVEYHKTAAVTAASAAESTRRNGGLTEPVEARAVEIVREETRADSDRDVSPRTRSTGNWVLSSQHHQKTTASTADRDSDFHTAGDGRAVSTQNLEEAERREAGTASTELEEGGVGTGGTDSGGGFADSGDHRHGSDGSGYGGAFERAKQRAWNVVASPVIIALVAGIVICVIEPLQDMLFHNPQAFLRPLGGAVQAVGVPTVTVSTLIMAGSLVLVIAPPPGGLAHGGGGEEASMPIWRRPGFIMGALLILLRLIAIPAILFGLFWRAKSQSSVMGENRLMQLILLVEFAMPSASLMITVLNQIRMPNTAGFLTRLLVWQFAASSVTVSIWTALAINMLY